MKRLYVVVLTLVLGGCMAPAPDIPWEPVPPAPPPPVEPPPPPPPVEPPPPFEPPGSLEEMLEQLVPGLTPPQVEEIVGSAPIAIPSTAGAWQARWRIDVEGEPYYIVAYFGPDALLQKSVLVKVETAP